MWDSFVLETTKPSRQQFSIQRCTYPTPLNSNRTLVCERWTVDCMDVDILGSVQIAIMLHFMGCWLWCNMPSIDWRISSVLWGYEQGSRTNKFQGKYKESDNKQSNRIKKNFFYWNRHRASFQLIATNSFPCHLRS